MALQIHPPPRETIVLIEEAIRESIDELVELEVKGGGGHFEIRVVSPLFAGKRTLERQRLVYAAIAHLMKGDGAPVHAVDRLEAVAPDA